MSDRRDPGDFQKSKRGIDIRPTDRLGGDRGPDRKPIKPPPATAKPGRFWPVWPSGCWSEPGKPQRVTCSARVPRQTPPRWGRVPGVVPGGGRQDRVACGASAALASVPCPWPRLPIVAGFPCRVYGGPVVVASGCWQAPGPGASALVTHAVGWSSSVAGYHSRPYT